MIKTYRNISEGGPKLTKNKLQAFQTPEGGEQKLKLMNRFLLNV
jgi:hypothetical protein